MLIQFQVWLAIQHSFCNGFVKNVKSMHIVSGSFVLSSRKLCVAIMHTYAKLM